MTRQSRLIAILAVMAILGTLALGWVADRYSRVIPRGDREGSAQTVEQARAAIRIQIAAFVQVRGALKQAIESGGLSLEMDEDALRIAFASERDRALTVAGLHPADYRELRGIHARFVRDDGTLDPLWRAGFESRVAALERCDLGPFTAYDR